MVIKATDVPNFTNVVDMTYMFAYASLANPDTTNWDTQNVTDMYHMF